MAQIQLLGGAYTAPDLIAGAQECINLVPEENPESAQSPTRITHYLRAGETLLSNAPVVGRGRCLYAATNGDLYAVVNQSVYFIDPNWVWSAALGTLVTSSTNPVYMADNGQTIFIVDGSVNGYMIDMATRIMTQTGDPNFLGADRVDFLDFFLIFNQPGTPNWYSTEAQSTLFNALFFGSKSAWADNIVTLIAIERQAYLLGPFKGEIWTDAGTSPFPFQPIPSNIIEVGCAAKYSIAKMGVHCFWLSQSPEGDRMVVRGGVGGQAERISTHAIEAEFKKYARVDDAIGVTYQLIGHLFYALHFPTQDVTWVWDERTQLWHREAWSDSNGVMHRRRGLFPAFTYGTSLLLDWNNGALYKNDPENGTDNGADIVRRRGFPHILTGDFDRVTFWRFVADIDVGNGPGSLTIPSILSPWSGGFSPGFGPHTILFPPTISLRMSRDRGHSWENRVMQPMGAAGLYLTTVTWWRLGYGRDIVFELEWSYAGKTALNGAYVLTEPHVMDSAVNQ